MGHTLPGQAIKNLLTVLGTLVFAVMIFTAEPHSAQAFTISNISFSDMGQTQAAQLFSSIKSFFGGTPTIKPGYKVNITGSGFTPEGNAVQFENKATKEIWEVLDIPSELNGTSITFYAPTSTPPGDYIMRIGAFNSPWAPDESVKIGAVAAPKLFLSFGKPTDSWINIGQPDRSSATIKWESQGVSSCVTTSNATGLPEVWTSPGYDGTFLFTPTVAGTYNFTMTCTGAGGTKVSQTLTVTATGSVTNTLALNLTASPAKVAAGSGSTVVWSATNGSTCVKTGSGDTQAVSAWTGNTDLSGTLYVKPYTTTTLTLSCVTATGQKKTTTSTITISSPAASGSLGVSCSTYPTGSAGFNELVTFTAQPSGGTGSYVYTWSGSDNLQGSTKSVSRYYTSGTGGAGAKTALVTVMSGGMSATASCNASISATKAPPVLYASPVLTDVSGTELRTGSSFRNGQSTSLNLGIRYGSPNLGALAGPASVVVLERAGVVSYIRPAAYTYGYDKYSSGSVSFVFEVPSTAVPGDVYKVSVQHWNGSSYVRTPSVDFTYMIDTIPTPTITSFTPTSGPLNTIVTMKGTSFTKDSLVVLRHAGVTKNVPATFSSDAYGQQWLSFPMTMNLPAGSAAGEYEVMVSTGSKMSAPSIFTVTVAPPTVTLNAVQTTANGGKSWNISWSISGADPSQCVPGGFIFSRNPSGSVSMYVLKQTVFSLSCTGPGGNTQKSIVAVPPEVSTDPNVPTPPAVAVPVVTPAQPTVDLVIKPTSVAEGGQVAVSWTATDATSCTFSADGDKGDEWSTHSGTVSTTGGATASTVVETKFLITCTGPGGTTSKSSTVTIADPVVESVVPVAKTITINNGALGSAYTVGQTIPIKWISTGLTTVKIDLLNYKGISLVRTIATVDAASGQYNWTVPADINFEDDTIYVISVSDTVGAGLQSKSKKIELLPLVSVVPSANLMANIREVIGRLLGR